MLLLFNRYTQDTTNYGSLHTSLPLLSNKLGSKAISDRENLFLQLREIRDNLVCIFSFIITENHLLYSCR